jgi:hypothetical protein
MLKKAHRPVLSLSLALILVGSLVSLAPSKAAAFDGPRTDQNIARNLPDVTSDREAGSTADAPKPLNVTSALYAGAAPDYEFAAAGPAVPATRPRTVGAAKPPNPLPPAPPPTSTAPMTPGEKFELFARKSFLSPGAYALSIVSGVYGEWTDSKNNHHHSKPGDFAADSMTRAARSFAFRANANFFEKFMFASLFRQDPRYHRSYKKSGGARIAYAVSRVFVTQGDRNGKDEFNISFIAGGLAASGMANLWERDERMDLHHFATRFGAHVGLTAFSNIVREFIGGQ